VFEPEKMSKNKLEKIQYNRFYQVIEERKNKIWTVKELLQRINKTIPSNLELTETGLRALISHQYIFNVFKCSHTYKGNRTTYYIFRKCLPIEKKN